MLFSVLQWNLINVVILKQKPYCRKIFTACSLFKTVFLLLPGKKKTPALHHVSVGTRVCEFKTQAALFFSDYYMRCCGNLTPFTPAVPPCLVYPPDTPTHFRNLTAITVRFLNQPPKSIPAVLPAAVALSAAPCEARGSRTTLLQRLQKYYHCMNKNASVFYAFFYQFAKRTPGQQQRGAADCRLSLNRKSISLQFTGRSHRCRAVRLYERLVR